MNVSIKQLTAFVVLAQCRSFAEACERLHLSQPALSIAIKNMEQSLGGSLFARTTRSLSLTPEGEQLLPVAKRLLADWDQALNDVSDLFSLARGRLTIAAMPSFAETKLPGILAGFTERFPNINVTLHDVLNESVVELISQGRAEVGICFKPPMLDDLNFTPLFDDPLVAIVHPDHPMAGRETISWQELLTQTNLSLAPPSSVRAHMEAALAEHDLDYVVHVEVNQLSTVKRLVGQGVGVAAVPQLCLLPADAGDTAQLSLVAPQVRRTVGVITRKRHSLSTAAAAMVAMVLEKFNAA